MKENKDLTTIDELCSLLKVTSKAVIWHRLKYLEIGEPVYTTVLMPKKIRAFTKEQVEMIVNMPKNKGGRGKKGNYSK